MPLDAKSIGSGAEGRLRQSEIAQLLHRFGDLPSREIRGKVVCAVRHHVLRLQSITVRWLRVFNREQDNSAD